MNIEQAAAVARLGRDGVVGAALVLARPSLLRLRTGDAVGRRRGEMQFQRRDGHLFQVSLERLHHQALLLGLSLLLSGARAGWVIGRFRQGPALRRLLRLSAVARRRRCACWSRLTALRRRPLAVDERLVVIVHRPLFHVAWLGRRHAQGNRGLRR
eukprot:5534702-Pleurochrysis_carterae.AAC.1